MAIKDVAADIRIAPSLYHERDLPRVRFWETDADEDAGLGAGAASDSQAAENDAQGGGGIGVGSETGGTSRGSIYNRIPDKKPATPDSLVPGQLINGSARDTEAALSRADWEDYKARFFPLEEELISRYDNPELRAQSQRENAAAVNTAFEVDKGVQQRRLSRYGTNLSTDQKEALDRANDVSRVATLTDTRNLTRNAYADIDEQILSGSAASTSAYESERA